MNLHEKSLLGRRVYGFSLFRNIPETLYDETIVPDPIPVEELPISEREQILRSIFSVDLRTGLPVGDISMLMSKDTHPDVLNFIHSQLLRPNSVSGDSAGDFAGLDDDTIASLTRDSNESLYAYRDRMIQYLRDNHGSTE